MPREVRLDFYLQTKRAALLESRDVNLSAVAGSE